MTLISKTEVGLSLRDFTKHVGIPNKLHSDRSIEQMGQKIDFQCAFQEICIKLRTSKPWPPWQNFAENVIDIIKGKWNLSTVHRKVMKRFWSF